MPPRTSGADPAEWPTLPSSRRLEPLTKDSALGIAVPIAVYLLYVAKLLVFAAGGLLAASLTPGVGSITDISSWWAEPVVYQKLVVWALLWEILGLGGGSVPQAFQRPPPVGGFRHWLRPGTVRLAPWPARVPFTAGTTRTLVDVALYALVLLAGAGLLGFTGSSGGTLPSFGIWLLLAPLAVLGLRDRTPFLAARPELYAVMLLVFLFPPANMIFALKLVLIGMWWGMATSQLTRHFPYAVAVLLSNSPWNRSRRVGRALGRRFPDDLQPSRPTRWLAYARTIAGFLLPVVLIVADGGALTVFAVTIMVLLHLHLVAAFPFDAPLDWNVFVAYSTVVLFGHYAGVGAGTLDSPLLAVLIAMFLLGLVVAGNLQPGRVSSVLSMRTLSGNSATSVWLFRGDAEQRVGALSPVRAGRAHDPHLPPCPEPAFRALHPHGRALDGLLSRAVDDLAHYTRRDGEVVARTVLGWSLGDGHLHDRSLLGAVRERCGFASGELRVITLEAQPIHRGEQRYRILDAADGLIEDGLIDVDDMLGPRSRLGADELTIPVEVLSNVHGFSGYTTPADFAFLANRDRANWHGLLDVPAERARRVQPTRRPAPKPPPRPTNRVLTNGHTTGGPTNGVSTNGHTATAAGGRHATGEARAPLPGPRSTPRHARPGPA